MSQPGFELQWKTTLESPVRHGVSLGAGVVASGVNIFTPLSIIAAPSNQVFAVDNDTGNLFWTRRFEGTLAAGTAACPGGISGTLTRMVNLTTPAPGAGRGGGRGRGSYSSAVGEPGAGVPIPGRGGAGRGNVPPPATPPACAGNDTATAGAAPVSPPPSTLPPGQIRPSPFPTNAAAQGSGGPVAPVRGRLRRERRRHVPNARVGVWQGRAAAGPVRSGRRTLLRSDCGRRQGLHRHQRRMRRRGRRRLGDRHRERHELRRLVEDQRRLSASGRSPSPPTAPPSWRLGLAPSRPAATPTRSSRSIRRRSP